MNKRRRYKAKRRRKIARCEWYRFYAPTYSERRAAILRLRRMGVRL